MAEPQIRYDDGAAYERYMGQWSRAASQVFFDWLAPAKGLRWVDVGCGNGAVTQLLVDRYAPAEVQGLDPSEAQIAYARSRPGMRIAEFRQGDAMALPFPDNTFDAAIMALVIFFVPVPATGVAEMVRVTRPGGSVATYAWDFLNGGFPYDPIMEEMRAMGHTPVMPPSAEASRMEALRDLWAGARLDAVEWREITVQRTFADFEEFWAIGLTAATIRIVVASMDAREVETLKRRVQTRVAADGAGRVIISARANAIKGRVP
jgi:ubiquinone/menaquinone biosynthesis C-methylase UbiE